MPQTQYQHRLALKQKLREFQNQTQQLKKARLEALVSSQANNEITWINQAPQIGYAELIYVIYQQLLEEELENERLQLMHSLLELAYDILFTVDFDTRNALKEKAELLSQLADIAKQEEWQLTKYKITRGTGIAASALVSAITAGTLIWLATAGGVGLTLLPVIILTLLAGASFASYMSLSYKHATAKAGVRDMHYFFQACESLDEHEEISALHYIN